MEFLTNTEILLAMLIVPAALALDWVIRNGNFEKQQPENQNHDNEDGFGFGPEGYGYYYKNGLKCTLFEEDD